MKSIIKTCGLITITILPLLCVFGIIRLCLGYSNFLPKYEDLFFALSKAPNGYEIISSDLKSVSDLWNNLEWSTPNMNSFNTQMAQDFQELQSFQWSISNWWEGLAKSFTCIGNGFRYFFYFFVDLGTMIAQAFMFILALSKLVASAITIPIIYLSWIFSTLLATP